MPRNRRKFDLNRNPHDPAFSAWLQSLDPYEELIVRLALREKRENLSGDPTFNNRIKALLVLLDPTPQEMAALMRRTRELEKEIDLAPDPDPAPTLRHS